MGSLRIPSVAIAGAGVSGLGMAIKLQQAGIDTFRIYEKSGAVGGTWRDNTYPGLFCDIPSRFYQYSFAPNPEWSRYYSPGPEIHRYLEDITDRFGLRPKISFDDEILAATWEGTRWRIRTHQGTEAFVDFLIAGCGFLHHLRIADIEGLDTFAGACFHSARWDHGVDLTGKRVGVIGSGSTGVQIVAALASQVGHLTHFQRTPQWVFPMPNPRYSAITKAAHRRFPALSGFAYRGWSALLENVFFRGMLEPGWRRRFVSLACKVHLRTVRDPSLRAKLRPSYQPMCKRLVVSGTFYREVQSPSVEVVTEAVERVEPRGVVTADGRLHELDVLVLATGFDVHAYVRPMELHGPDGFTLEDAWKEDPVAYRTVAVPGLPNFFMTTGPHSPIANSSMFYVAETQIDYVMGCINEWRSGRVDAMTPAQEATDRYNAELRDALPGTVWVTGCQSWYMAKDGLPQVWPWSARRHREMLSEPDFQDFDLLTAGEPAPGG